MFAERITETLKAPEVTVNGSEADAAQLIERSDGGSVPGLHFETRKAA